jgi:hypothetical protein
LIPWLRDWLLAHRDNYPARDAVLRELIDRARTLKGDWRIVAVAMAMPALIRLAGGLARPDPTTPDPQIRARMPAGAALPSLRLLFGLSAPRPMCAAAYS